LAAWLKRNGGIIITAIESGWPVSMKTWLQYFYRGEAKLAASVG